MFGGGGVVSVGVSDPPNKNICKYGTQLSAGARMMGVEETHNSNII